MLFIMGAIFIRTISDDLQPRIVDLDEYPSRRGPAQLRLAVTDQAGRNHIQFRAEFGEQVRSKLRALMISPTFVYGETKSA